MALKKAIIERALGGELRTTQATRRELDLPSTVNCKDDLGSSIFAAEPNGHGVQLSLGGLLGVAASALSKTALWLA